MQKEFISVLLLACLCRFCSECWVHRSRSVEVVSGRFELRKHRGGRHFELEHCSTHVESSSYPEYRPVERWVPCYRYICV